MRIGCDRSMCTRVNLNYKIFIILILKYRVINKSGMEVVGSWSGYIITYYIYTNYVNIYIYYSCNGVMESQDKLKKQKNQKN